MKKYIQVVYMTNIPNLNQDHESSPSPSIPNLGRTLRIYFILMNMDTRSNRSKGMFDPSHSKIKFKIKFFIFLSQTFE